MLEWLFRSINGYVRICLRGGSPERFLNLCNARGLTIWGILCGKNGEYAAFMPLKDVRRVKPLVKKSGGSACLFLFTETKNAGTGPPALEPFFFCSIR